MLFIKPRIFLVLLSLSLVLIFIASLGIGASEAGILSLFDVSAVDHYVVAELRLPRALLAFLVGGVLGLSGAVLQTLFRNPLADPSLIGVSSGSALAAAAVLVLGYAFWGTLFQEGMSFFVMFAAFLGGVLATVLIVRISIRQNRLSLATVLLVGIAINALAMSGIGLLSYIANEATLRSLTFWMLGSLSSATWSSVGMTALFTIPVLLGIPFLARSLNALLLGEAEARHLGVRVERLKNLVLIASALGVAATVAVAGIIGFVGLVIPHIVRMSIGADHRYLLPGSILLGGGLLMLADIASRTWVAPAELPIGIITALFGAPFFLMFIMRQK